MSTTRINPHPSRDPKYDVEIVREDEEKGVVLVHYIGGNRTSWWVNSDVPNEAWTVEDDV